jgi:hypothetical protein
MADAGRLIRQDTTRTVAQNPHAFIRTKFKTTNSGHKILVIGTLFMFMAGDATAMPGWLAESACDLLTAGAVATQGCMRGALK